MATEDENEVVTQDDHDAYLEAIEAEMAGDDREKPEPKPDRDPSGKFKKPDEQSEEEEVEEDDDLLNELPEAEEPDKKNLSKKVEQQGYAIANITKQMGEMTSLLQEIKAQGGKATARQQDELEDLQEQANAELDELVSEYGADHPIVKYARKMAKGQKPDTRLQQQVEAMQRLLSDQQWYMDKASETGLSVKKLQGIVDQAWGLVKERHPTLEDGPYKQGKADAYIDLLIARATKTKTTPKSEEQPSPKPSPSTKGAKTTASSGASRPQQSRQPTEDEELEAYAAGIYDEMIGGDGE